MTESAMKLRAMLDQSKAVAFFGGAGVSTESGIPDFRSNNGVFQAMREFNEEPETLLHISTLRRRPEVFFRYYFKYLIATEAKPNAAHKALAYLEKTGKLLGVVTQNIDGLHQAAGSQAVYDLHGSNARHYCQRCGRDYTLEQVLPFAPGVPRCPCGGIIRPRVVLYGEGLDEATMRGAAACIAHADTLVVGGTSLMVWPAAGFAENFNGDRLILINKSPTFIDDRADLVIREGIAASFQEAYEGLI